MSVQIDDAVPLIRAQRLGGNTLWVVCPFCRDPHGKPRVHWHGAGGQPGPWHRLAHCCDADLPKRLRERRRDGPLSYELVEVSAPCGRGRSRSPASIEPHI
jgi:hypothetical protein